MKKLVCFVLAVVLAAGPVSAAAGASAGASAPWTAEELRRAVVLLVEENDQKDVDPQREMTRKEFVELLMNLLATQYGYRCTVNGDQGTAFSMTNFMEDYLDRHPGPDGQPFNKADYLTAEALRAGRSYTWPQVLSSAQSPIHIFHDLAEHESTVYLACLMGIVKGKGGGVFAPDTAVSRQEAAVFLTRAYRVYGTPELREGERTPFTDQGDVADWAAESVAVMDSWGVLTGDENRAFRPKAPLTWGEGLAALLRLYEDMPVSQSKGGLAPLRTQAEVVEQYSTRETGMLVQTLLYKVETETCVVCYVSYGGVMHAPGPRLVLLYPDSTVKIFTGTVYYNGAGPFDGIRLTDGDTKLTFYGEGAYGLGMYSLDLKTGAKTFLGQGY